MIKDFVEQIKIGQVNDESLINASEIVELIECIKKQTVWGVTQ